MRQGRRVTVRHREGFFTGKDPLHRLQSRSIYVEWYIVHGLRTGRYAPTAQNNMCLVCEAGSQTNSASNATTAPGTQAAFPQERHIFVRSARLAPSAPLDRKVPRQRGRIFRSPDPAAVLHVQLVDIRQARMEVVVNAPLVLPKCDAHGRV